MNASLDNPAMPRGLWRLTGALCLVVLLAACAPGIKGSPGANAPVTAVGNATPAVTSLPGAVGLPAEFPLSYADWKDWPILPVVTRRARAVYQLGLSLGRDPHVFSVLGDCQSLPETFMGVYDTDPAAVSALPADLQETVAQFSGSFSATGPTLKEGSTAGAMLWDVWHGQAYTCAVDETPLDCELRRRNPSIAIINLGTHYETRNIIHMRTIIETLIGQGVLPILATKADNRELDEHLNYEAAMLAVEYGLPLWNFYSAVSDLPNNGVSTHAGEEALGDIYLSEEGLARHRLTALQALDVVWRAVR